MKQDRKITNYQEESRPLFAGIDIGSAHAVCVVGTIDHEKKIINVLGGGTTDSSGIEAGAITNIAEAASSIKSALEKAERIAGGHAEAAVVAIRGSFIEARGAVGTAATDISTKTVTQEVKDNAVNNAQETVTGELPANSDVFQVVVRGLLLDKNKGSVGMKGLSLEADVYALSAPLFNMENINSSLETAEIKSIKMIYSYLASSDILIRQEEYEGCLIVDFGGSTIGLVIYVDKTLRFTYEFPTGSEMITKGISRYLKTSWDEARKIKETYGAAIIADDFDDSDFEYNASDGKTIKRSNRGSIIQHIIQIEIDKTLCAIESVLKKNNFNIDDMSGGIILTGGGSGMQNIKEAFERFFDGVPVRVATPLENKVKGNKEILSNASYTAAIGALYHAISSDEYLPATSKPSGTTSLGKFFKMIKSIKEKL